MKPTLESPQIAYQPYMGTDSVATYLLQCALSHMDGSGSTMKIVGFFCLVFLFYQCLFFILPVLTPPDDEVSAHLLSP